TTRTRTSRPGWRCERAACRIADRDRPRCRGCRQRRDRAGRRAAVAAQVRHAAASRPDLGKPIVVGRTTYLSFTKPPLPGRTNFVVSRNKNFAAPGALVASSLDAALEVARGDALRRAADAIIVLGGADVYAQTMPIADRLVITRVHLEPDGDAKFPAID